MIEIVYHIWNVSYDWKNLSFCFNFQLEFKFSLLMIFTVSCFIIWLLYIFYLLCMVIFDNFGLTLH